ncbi:MAG: LexA family transcriptional regulator [Desulfovibrio sp.]|uniref:LexA family transcriptional regulator n=1 Tax=Desulfovibrio sp. 7SRBS1 TaxID=3378064 RepID=UPI003B405598
MTIFDEFYSRIRKATGLQTQQELAALLGVNRSAITQAKKRGAVPERWILKVSRDMGLSPDWLENGRGPERMPSGAAYGTNDDDFERVPKVRARLCAGGGSFETGGDIEGFYSFRREWLRRKGNSGRMVLMDVFGNSMEPEIREGDTALLDQAQKDIIAGGIYAVGLEDTVMLKRVEKRPGVLVLLSDNVDYSPIYLRGEEIDQCRIIGKVVWVCREYR